MNLKKISKKAFVVFNRVYASVAIKRNRYCVICKNHIGFFMPYKSSLKTETPLMKALETVGSDIKNFSCPRCMCHDRERHLHLYLQSTNLYGKIKDSKVLHFAPERRLSLEIKKSHPKLYVVADLHPTTPSVEKVDITEMQFEDNSFDFVIANHVLEHVDNSTKALLEIHRVLRNGGYAILQTPYSKKLANTFCDPGIDTADARVQAYGQDDHVRLFGNNIFELFSASGLRNRVKTHQDLLKDIDPAKYGVNSKEPFFLFQKAP